jgi:hypothetical protein
MTVEPLVNPNEVQLNEAFALHVAGRKLTPEIQPAGVLWDVIAIAKVLNENERRTWRFAQSVDAVLPYLEAWRVEDRDYRLFLISHSGHDYVVELGGHQAGATIHRGSSLARALVICLLRAKGIEVTFT